MALPRRVRFFAEDIWQAPEDGKIYEVIDGDLYATPSPSWSHQRSCFKLAFHLAQYVYTHDLGEIVTAPAGVVLDEENGVEPDILYISRERVGIISERGGEGAPDLIVEALSPSTEARDRGLKMRRYARAGVPDYWLMGPHNRTLEAYRLRDGEYERTSVYGPAGSFCPDLFLSLEIPLSDLSA